jgi:hypothetical protein
MQSDRHNRVRSLTLLLFAFVAIAPALSYDYLVQSIQSIIRRVTTFLLTLAYIAANRHRKGGFHVYVL